MEEDGLSLLGEGKDGGGAILHETADGGKVALVGAFEDDGVRGADKVACAGRLRQLWRYYQIPAPVRYTLL